jgi:hypothetical protein
MSLIHFGQVQIEQNQFRLNTGITAGVQPGAEQVVKRFYPIMCHHHLVRDLTLPESAHRQRFVITIVFHEQYQFPP